MKVKVGAYCRVSTDKDDQINSLESQKKYFNDYIKSKGEWELVDIYADEGISGTQVKNRIEFQRMIEDARNRRLDLILTKEISRFARNTLDSIEYTRMLRKLGIGVIFINDNINTLDGDGELRLTIMAGIAQDESRRTSERVKWGQKRRMEQGVVFGRELLGYSLKKGVLTVNEEEAQIVRMIFHKYAIEGKGTHIIARELYEAGIKSKKHRNKWSNGAILKILKNEKYVGDLLQKKTITPDYLDHKKKYNEGEEEFVYIKNHHSPIIERDLWEKTKLELQKRTSSGEQRSKYSNRYWCSGKVICGECGSKFICKSKKLKNGARYIAWICQQAKTQGKRRVDENGNTIGCNNESINHIIVSDAVNYILQLISYDKEQILAELMTEIKKLKHGQNIRSLEPLLRKIDTLIEKKQDVINLQIEGSISKDDMILMIKKYDKEIEKLKNEVESIEKYNFKSKEDNLQLYTDRIKAMLNGLKGNDFNEIYKRMVDKIIVFKNKTLEIYLSYMPASIKIHYNTVGRGENYNAVYELIIEI
ncbi:recombinase family protein [Ruminiclostridium herbifermentans]|uniref:Recombinase family protein n=1 Tax=Ruminiclostridium herbifermentans TaxID=2488810 RepID=A0A4V6ENT0_9FIRM|nr:recombinase family protein [Ruminiclostridium herbifermentans]QNU65763.1 recombinase family protein [Ruminiclostridium herbifermentans]